MGGVWGETFRIDPNPNTTQSKIFDKESTQQIFCCVLKTPFLSKPIQLGLSCVVKTLRPPLPKSFRNPRFSRSFSPHGRFNGWNRPFCLVFPQRRVAKKFDEKTGSAPAWRFSQHFRGGALVDDWTDVSLARKKNGGTTEQHCANSLEVFPQRRVDGWQYCSFCGNRFGNDKEQHCANSLEVLKSLKEATFVNASF